ncbi:hypothetical protein DRJ22_04730 [Candidatus Woesearchaeota archaeon]|nr:MAG: hypothetical protein DRJ22_04730 [Candidatus Woesearchaeota archaeon]
MSFLNNRKGFALKALEIFFAIPIIALALILTFAHIKSMGVEKISRSVFDASSVIELDYRFVDRMKDKASVYDYNRIFVDKKGSLSGKLTFEEAEKKIALFFKCGNFFEVADGEFDCPDFFRIEKGIPSLVCDNLFLSKTNVYFKPVITTPRGLDENKKILYNREFFVPSQDKKISKVRVSGYIAPYVRELTDEVYCE